MKDPAISVCIVCFNEETNIRECLESVKWVKETGGEIIVVDSLSRDGTVKICQNYTDRIYQERWRGYVAQKNYALSLATHDWVLALDADERVSDELRQEIQQEWNKSSYQEYAGFYIPRHTYYLGKWINHGGWYPDYKLRLFRKSLGQWIGIDPHDRVSLSHGKTKRLKSDLLHYTYRDLSDQLASIDQFARVASQALMQKGKRFSLFNLLVRPPIKFLECYLVKHGFLDGLPGLIIAVNSAFYVFTKYARMWETHLEETRNQR